MVTEGQTLTLEYNSEDDKIFIEGLSALREASCPAVPCIMGMATWLVLSMTMLWLLRLLSFKPCSKDRA